MKIRRVLLVVKKTAYSILSEGRSKGDARMRRLLAQHHGSVARIRPAHEEHSASVRLVRRELRARGIDVVERTRPPRTPVNGCDLVVSVGGDGTLLDVSHALKKGIPLLGVNSAPAFSVGFLTGCRAPTFAATLDALIASQVSPLIVERLQVRIGKRTLPEPVLNDVLFCADNPAVTTRYRLMIPKQEELQRSSGLWIATPAGTTAALRSAGGPPLPLTARAFAYIVREPYAPLGSSVRLEGGVLKRGERLLVECRIAEASIFLDGSHRRYSVPFGETVAFSLHEQPLRLVRGPSDGGVPRFEE